MFLYDDIMSELISQKIEIEKFLVKINLGKKKVDYLFSYKTEKS